MALYYILSFVKKLLPGEQDVPGQHASHAGDLFLLMHHIVSRNIGLKVKCHLPTNPERKIVKPHLTTREWLKKKKEGNS